MRTYELSYTDDCVNELLSKEIDATNIMDGYLDPSIILENRDDIDEVMGAIAILDNYIRSLDYAFEELSYDGDIEDEIL